MTVVITDTGVKIGPGLAPAPVTILNVTSFLFKSRNVVEIVGDVRAQVELASDTTVAYSVATQTLTLS